MSHIVLSNAEWRSESRPITWGNLRRVVESDVKENGVVATAVRFDGVDNPTYVHRGPREAR